MRRSLLLSAAMSVVTVATLGPAAGAAPPPDVGVELRYVVLYADGADPVAARAAVRAAGGSIVTENPDVGLATVRSASSDFPVRVDGQPLFAGVARDRVFARVPGTPSRPAADLTRVGPGSVPAPTADAVRTAVDAARDWGARHGRPPLEGLQWDYRAIRAAAAGPRAGQGKGVLVGVLDTGVDASHPDIAPNFDIALSRNFTVDIPTDADGNVIDGPCEPGDVGCKDPVDVDENGHGTHVASVIAASLRGVGLAGIAPEATIVSLRTAQDSGYAFLQPTVDALTYAANTGIAVVDMVYYLDPWVFNCPDNPADSAVSQREQRTILTAMRRALDYAHRHGVTMVTAAGARAVDYTKPHTDVLSPDFVAVPGMHPYPREITPACKSLPAQGEHVIAVGATGISGRKAYYSSYGNGYVAVTDPGGDMYDTPDGKIDPTRGVLGAYPRNVAVERGQLNPDGTPNDPTIVRSCRGSVCGYYQFRQIESEHTAGIATLVVARYGHRDPVHGGLVLDPDVVETIIRRSAREVPCPQPPTVTYTRQVLGPDGTYQTVVSTATCEGTANRNGFFGDGVVDALAAVR